MLALLGSEAMTESQQFVLFLVLWIGSIAATGYWIIWKIKRDDT